MKVARRQKLRDRAPLRLVTLPLPRRRRVNVQSLQSHAVRRERVGDAAALELVLVALARQRPVELARAAHRGFELQRVGRLRQINRGVDLHVVAESAPIVERARHVRLCDGRAKGQVAYVRAHLIDARVQLYVNGVDGVPARRKSRVRHPEVNLVGAALGGRIRVFGLDDDLGVFRLARNIVASVVVV